jgi:hypothetical protein
MCRKTRKNRRNFSGPLTDVYFILHCQQVRDSCGAKKGVGVAENPRSGVGARGSSVKKGRGMAKFVALCHQ